MKQFYFVVGGEFKDMTFEEIRPGTDEKYGPFDTYSAAYDQWKSKVWMRVDTATHRLVIVSRSLLLG